MKNLRPQTHAFTIVELLVVVVTLALLAATIFPARAATKGSAQRVYCSSNLKQVGIAFRTWAAAHNGRMPMAVSEVQGGAPGAVGITATASWTGGANPNVNRGVYWMYMVMSNELATPKILFCPSEGAQSHGSFSAIGPQATVFGPRTSQVQGFQNDLNVSYFVGVDANEIQPTMLLAGDHNLGYLSNQATKTSSFSSVGTNSNWSSFAIGWQDNNHAKQGNVTFADGSVQILNTDQLRQTLNKTGDTGRSAGVFALTSGSLGSGVNRLQFP